MLFNRGQMLYALQACLPSVSFRASILPNKVANQGNICLANDGHLAGMTKSPQASQMQPCVTIVNNHQNTIYCWCNIGTYDLLHLLSFAVPGLAP